MASSPYQTEPSTQHLEASPQQHVSDSNGVNSITQLSMTADTCDSPPTTSTQLMFSCQTNTNLNGNLLFPLAANDENTMKHKQKISRNNLLKYLRSQRIIKNIEIFKNSKSKNTHFVLVNSKFPLAEEGKMKMENFPFQNTKQDNLNDNFQRKEAKLKNLMFPLKTVHLKRRFPYIYSKGLKGKNEKELKNINSKLRQLDSKLKHHSNLKRTLRKLSICTNLQRFPCPTASHFRASKEFPLQHNLHSLCRNNKKDFKFPLEITKNKRHFPIVNKIQSEINLYIPDDKAESQAKQIWKTLENAQSYEEPSNKKLIKTFPCPLAALSCVSKFPISNQFTQHEHSFNHNLSSWGKVNMNENSKISNSLSSLSMTQSDPKIENIVNEHVLQVQDAQVYIDENPRSLTTIENKHPPPQTAIASRIHDDYKLLADINSINYTRPNEVGYYAEKIERLQDAIVALFEKIQNSLTNHNTKQESTNAAKHDHGGGNNRFALTPPMSVTSVQNTESSYDNKEALHSKYDLGDLCDRQVGPIVEYSEVRDTLVETVACGVTKEKNSTTGSFLVKSEEPTSPNSLTPNPLNESEHTSLTDYTNISELLAENNVLAVNEEIKVDLNNRIDTQNKSNDTSELTHETVLNTNANNWTIEKASAMTGSRLKQQENTKQKNSLQANEACEHKNNILQINEMKYEMKKVKGALPSSVSERSLGKHDDLKIGTSSTRLSNDTPLGNNRLPYILNSTRNHSESSYAPRSAVKNESSSLATTVPRAATYTTQLRQDGIINPTTINTPSLNNATLNRTASNSSRNSSEGSVGTLSHRRPSLGSLRNTQSTSLLSVDLAQLTAPRPTLSGPSDRTTLGSRAVSIDSSILPERTRLRRQRRLLTQGSKDEPDDPLERLNILKARISASLSEVKGVLKQYSTETENENENQAAADVNSANEIKENEKKEDPITFRFVKKVRRRSIFTEDDETEQMETEKSGELANQQTNLEVKDETDNYKLKPAAILPTKSSAIIGVSNKKPAEKQVEANGPGKQQLMKTNEIKVNTNLYPLKEEAQESMTGVTQTESKPQITIVQQQITKDEPHGSKDETKGAIPKPTIKHETNKSDNDASQLTPKKMKKKIIIKSRDPSRRASLAAVEASKIEPPVKLAVPAKIERRPSDSETVIKKKLAIDKLNTSGMVEEVTPKLIVKKYSTKINNNSQLAAEQTKLKEKATANATSDHLVKAMDEGDNKSIQPDNNKVALMPKQPEAERQQRQQINTEITRQTNSLLPAQLVIDEAASLNAKTITNSMLPPRQQQQQHREQDQQATINSTATNCISNDLQAKGAMLEHVTTVLSSSTASEANGQTKRENIVQQEDFHDLLQQETTIIKPSTTNKQNELKPLKQVESDQSKIKNTHNKLKGNLESVKTTTQKQQQEEKTPTLYQQVIATTDVADAKSYEGNNKNEDIKAKLSLKEPCKDKTTTPTHVKAEHQQREDEQSITNVDETKTISSPHISISSTADITHKTTTASILSSDSAGKEKAELSANQQNTMPELKLAPAPVQTADIISHPELHKKKIIIKKVVRQTSTDKTKKLELEKRKFLRESEQITAEEVVGAATLNKTKTAEVTDQVRVETLSNKKQEIEKVVSEAISNKTKAPEEADRVTIETPSNKNQETEKAVGAATLNTTKPAEVTEQVTAETPSNKKQETEIVLGEATTNKQTEPIEEPTAEAPSELSQDELTEEYSESTEISDVSNSIDSEEVTAAQTPKKERKVKRKVIIKREKRRLSISDNFFQHGNNEEQQNNKIETLEKPIAYVTDTETEQSDKEDDEEVKNEQEPEEKKPLKSCILHKEYNIGDEVLYAERYKKTQIKWRRGRVKERITSISYLLDIDGKDVSSHINYLKRFTGRKVSFGGKEYLEIDYEQLAEEEEKAERLQRRTYSIWNMV